jgi:hypothetical protein
VADDPSYHTKRWAKHFAEIDSEIAKLAMLLKIRLLEPGVIERVLHNDPAVCGAPKPQMFEKLRGLLMMHYSVRTKALEAIGTEETLLIVGEIVDRLRERYGDSLGGPVN